MDVFGQHWKEHPEKIEASWRRKVSPNDIVLVAGDISWASKIGEARSDLDWLEALPGRKVIVKGNHDYWFPKSRRKRSKFLGDSIHSIYRNSVFIDGLVFIGSKGVSFDPEEKKEEDSWQKYKERELAHLRASLKTLGAINEEIEARIALLHYPPTAPGESRSEFTDFLESAEIDLCVYGHLHSSEDFETALQGLHRGIHYRLSSADSLSFELLELTHLLASSDK